MIALSNQQARHLILHLQGLTRPPHIRQNSDDLYDLVCQMGFVQVDSIQWVERAQHMTLFARNQTYRPKHLKNLIEKDRRLFEGWTHDASIIPCEYLPYWRHRFMRQEKVLREKFINWQGEGFLSRCDDLLELIASKGPLRSRDMEKPQPAHPQKMWQWHDGKAALEYLWRTGRLAISGRDGFQKVYDLAQNALPEDKFFTRVDHDEFVDWACRSALLRLGFATPADIARYWDLVSIAEVREWLARQNDSTLIEITVESADKSKPRQFIARADIAKMVANLPKIPNRLRVLSPFDPVIRDRNRLEWLFNFEYRIEIYVPEVKRKYGYYVFPLLEKDRVIGRIDMRAHRRDNQLQVKNIWLEKGVKMSASRKARLDSELVRQCRLAGVDEVVWLNSD